MQLLYIMLGVSAAILCAGIVLIIMHWLSPAIQEVLRGSAQFMMLLTLFVIIASHSLLMYNLERHREKVSVKRGWEAKETQKIIRILRLFWWTAIVLFVDIILCLTRIFFALSHFHTNCLAYLDFFIILLFALFVVGAIVIFCKSFPKRWRGRKST